jgi:hypothetical protein
MRWKDLGRPFENCKALQIAKVASICCFFAFFLGPAPSRALANMEDEIVAVEGQITLLRVHDVGTGYGPPADFLDAEVIVQLDSRPSQAFGFQLRSDGEEAARNGMLDVLRMAFNTDTPVRIEFIDTGSINAVMIRVATLPKVEEFDLFLPHIRR